MGQDSDHESGGQQFGYSMAFVVREPALHSTPIAIIGPTQMTVGMREVVEKRRSWRKLDPKKREESLRAHMLPVILGPGKAPIPTKKHQQSTSSANVQSRPSRSLVHYLLSELRYQGEFWRPGDRPDRSAFSASRRPSWTQAFK
jgi:hypothetical protein